MIDLRNQLLKSVCALSAAVAVTNSALAGGGCGYGGGGYGGGGCGHSQQSYRQPYAGHYNHYPEYQDYAEYQHRVPAHRPVQIVQRPQIQVRPAIVAQPGQVRVPQQLPQFTGQTQQLAPQQTALQQLQFQQQQQQIQQQQVAPGQQTGVNDPPSLPSGPPTQAGPPAPPAPPAPASPDAGSSPSALDALGGFAPPQETQASVTSERIEQPAHVGNWTARLGNGATVSLELGTDGSFQWLATNKDGESSTFRGSYSVNTGSLSLLRSLDNQTLAGRFNMASSNSFSFSLNGKDAAALTFSRS